VAEYEEERLARVEQLLGMGEYTPDDPGGISTPDPDAMTRPMYVRARENNDRSVSLFWSGASPVYEVHEFLADPSATLKATVTVGTRTSGPLVNGNTYEYAVRGVVGSAYTEFSERARITIGQAPSSSPGGTGGWVDPGAEPTDPDTQPPPPPPDPVVDLTTAAGRNGWGVPKWTEEFNYNGPPDPLKWSVYDGEGHAGNGVRSPSRVTVDGTKMIMTGLNGTGNTAGMMHKAKEVYGRYEWRARSFYTGDPTAPGNKSGGYHPVALVWPSKPYKPGTTSVVSWPYGGEYDPMENGEPGMQTAGCFHHYPSLDGQNHQLEAPDFPADMREWNNFAFEWTSQHLKGWVNGELWYTMSGGAAADRKAIQMMEEGRFCFQLDAFDSGSGNIASTMEVDWLRFYPLIPIQPDPGTGTPPPPTGTNTSPWANAHLDGVTYPVITGGGTANAQTISSLGVNISSNGVYQYSGSDITSAVSLDFTGKSNITIKGIKMADPAKLTPKAGTNIIIEVEAPYELQNGGETVKWVGVYNRCLVTNSLFGPASPDSSPTTVKNRYVQFGDSTSVGATHGRLTRSTLRNKNGPGNPVHAVGDTANATGGVRYTIVAHNLFQGVKPFDENDHESALMGISTLQLTNGQQIVEFNRFEDCRSEPEVISMKMNWSAIRGNTFHNCVGSLSLRHGDDGVIAHNWVYGFEEEVGTGSYNRTSAGPRIYGARHKVFNNTIQVNGNGGSRPSATSLFESPLTLDTGDVAPGSTSNAHANIVACMVEKNLLVKCGNPICSVDNYSTAPQGTVRDNWIVECANAGTDGVRAFGTGSKANLNITGNSVYSTVANAGLTAGSGGHYLPPTGMDRGSKAPYLTAAMVGRGSTYDPYGGTTSPPPPVTPPSSTQTLGVGGIARPAAASNVELNNANRGDMNITVSGTETVPRIYDGGGFTCGRITISANYIIIQNYNVRPNSQYGVYITGSHVTVQNCDVKDVRVSGDGDLNAFTLLDGSNIKLLYNTAVNYVSGDPGDSHTDAVQTWISSSHPTPVKNVQIVGNKFVGPANPSRLNSIPSIHQIIMVESAGRGGNSGGSGTPSDWLIADNEFGDSWNQAVKTDFGDRFIFTRNRFYGSSDKVFGDLAGTGNVVYSDNIFGTGYGSVGATVTSGSGPAVPGTSTGGGGTTTPPPVSSAQYPADILNLVPWKITLPVIQDGKVKEVRQPELARFTDKHFLVNSAKDGVLFRVWHGGGTTSNSSNPRSELREMNSSGSTEYNWNATSGTHAQTVVGMVSRLTKVKPHVVLWQIHGGDDDTTVFRLEGSSLWITNGDNTHAKLITSSFQLNQRYTLKGEVKGGVCSYWYNGVKIDYTLSISDTSCYFKAGNYLQSNPTSAPSESTSEYSEVTIYSVSVTHS
jgi:hypothetical protein